MSRRGAIAGAAALAEPAVEELFEDYTVVETKSWPEDVSDFTLTNLSSTTVGGQPALRPTVAGTLATLMTDAMDIEDVRVSVLYVPLADAGFTIDNIAFGPASRWTGDDAHYEIRRGFADAASALHTYEIGSGLPGGFIDGGSLGGVTDLDKADTTTPRWLVMDNFLDLVRGKEWFSDDAEPDWLGARRYLPWSGYGGTPSNSADNIISTGSAGIRAQYGGAILRVIVERLQRSTNALANGDASIIETAGQPYFWSFTSADQAGGNGAHLVTTDGPTGETETVYECSRTTEGDGPEWNQTWALIDPTTHPAGVTRARPLLGQTSFPTTMRIGLWTRGVSLANSNVGTKLTSIVVVYYYDDANANLMGTGPGGTDQDYHFKPGPGGIDIGSWVWSYVTHDIPLYSHTDIAQLRIGIGLHDPTVTGKLQFSPRDLSVEFL